MMTKNTLRIQLLGEPRLLTATTDSPRVRGWLAITDKNGNIVARAIYDAEIVVDLSTIEAHVLPQTASDKQTTEG